MARSFDKIAIIYDFLAWLVFGNTIKHAQSELLQVIPPGSRILIIGGGSGWVLDELSMVHGTGLRITYIDSSPKMISKAKKRYIAQNRVKFVTESAKTALLKDTYDVVITPFFFDMFGTYNAQQIFEKIHRHINENTLWLYSDFTNTEQNTIFQHMLLKVMYVFFRLTCGIEAKKMPDMDRIFNKYGYRLALEKKFKGGFITSRVYQPSALD